MSIDGTQGNTSGQDKQAHRVWRAGKDEQRDVSRQLRTGYTVNLTRSRKLDSAGRAIMRAIVDMSTRDTLTQEHLAKLAERDARLDRREPLTEGHATWRGIVGSSTVRVTARWAADAGGTGSDSLRLAERVSVADVHKPVELLKSLVTVGIATHPSATWSNYGTMIAHCRANPQACTVRVYRAGDSVGTVESVRELHEPQTARQANQSRTHAPATAYVAPLIARMDAIGNVE